MHGIGELLGIGLVAICATLCGMTMVQFRQPPIIGYILAGIILGPGALGLVSDRESIELLAELGVILLLYFIGIELSLKSFKLIWKQAVTMALMQIFISLGIVLAVAPLVGITVNQAILFAFCLALSSTAVSVTVVQDIGESNTKIGRLVIGILIAQDLAVAPMLLIVAGVGGGGASALKITLEVAITIALLIGVILILTRKKHINLPFADLLTTKKDLTPLAILGWCFTFALITGLAGLSPAFGAFIAGLIVGNSAQQKVAHENAEPIKVILMMAFFLSVGLLLDIDFLFANLPSILLMLVVVTFFKTILNTLGLRLLREEWKSAFMCSLLLGQMGEFSFVIGAAALAVGIIDQELQRYLIAVTILSLVVSPIYVDLARRMHERAFKIKTDDKGFLYSLAVPILIPYWFIRIVFHRARFRITRKRLEKKQPDK